MLLAFIIAGLLLGIIYAILMLRYLYGWIAIPAFIPASLPPTTKVSIIIAARNEEKNIGACLDRIMKQDYPAGLFEVIVVNDHSTDGTVAVVRQYERVKLLRLQAHPTPFDSAQGDNAAATGPSANPSLKREVSTNGSKSLQIAIGIGGEGKKKAIEKGIEAATGQLIITTDADCISGPQWLSTMVACYEKDKPVMIAAPVCFTKVRGATGIWQVLDMAGLIGITGSGIKLHFPQMCNGANLAYEKSAFQQVGGFNDINGVPTGDDILLMLKIAYHFPNGVRFLKSADAMVSTLPQPTISSLASQRIRWVSKSKVFTDPRINGVLVIAWFFNFIILTGLMLGLIWHQILWFSLFLFFIKTLFELPLVFLTLRLSQQTKYIWHLPWVQFIHLIYVVIIGPSSLFAKYEWKGRKY